MLSVQLGASVAKTLFNSIGPEASTLLRVALSALILNLVVRPWRGGLDRPTIVAIAPYGAALGAMNLLFYLALSRIPLGVAVAIEFTGPLAVALGASRRPIDFAWASLAALGIFLLTPWSGEAGGPPSLDPVGVLEALAAGLFWGLYILFGKRAGARAQGPHAVAVGMAFATLVVVPFSIFHLATVSFTPRLVGFAFVVAVLSSALPYSLEIVALRKLPTQLFGILMSLEPAIGAVVGFLFLHEALDSRQVVAIALVMAASLGSAWGSSTRPLLSAP